jgi:hypothetical protein
LATLGVEKNDKISNEKVAGDLSMNLQGSILLISRGQPVPAGTGDCVPSAKAVQGSNSGGFGTPKRRTCAYYYLPNICKISKILKM